MPLINLPLSLPSGWRSRSRALCLLLSTMAPATVWAEASAEEADYYLQLSLQELLQMETSIASGESSSILKSISTVSVITRDDIERFNYATLEEALKTLAGFDVSRTYFQKSIPTGRGILQDHYANKVLLMINNVPTWHAVTGELHLARINIHDVEKIEVLKGPASVLYGTNAYSGAINVVLKKPEETLNRISVAAGDDHHYEAGGSWSYVSEQHDLSLLLSAQSKHGGRQPVRFVDEDGQRGHYDDYTDSNILTLNGRYQNHSLLFNAYDNTEAYMGIEPFYDLGVGAGQDLRGYLLGYQFEMAPDDVSKLKISARYDWNERRFLRSVSQGVRGETSGYHLAAKISYSRQLNDYYYAEGGIDADYRVSEVYRNYLPGAYTLTHNNLKGQDVMEYSVFASLGYERDNWKWNIGLRNVENELFTNALSGRATLVYSLSESSSVKLIAGQSYRSPSMFELYFIPPEQTIFGNPELSPEKSTSYELAYLKSFGNFFVQMNAYRGVYQDRIYRDTADVRLPDNTIAYDTLRYTNGDHFDSTGLEIEARYNSANWSAFGNFNWQKGSDGDRLAGTDHYNFKYIPTYTTSAGMSRRFGDINLSSVFNFRSGTDGTTEQDIESSLTLDLAASYKHRLGQDSHLKHRLKLNNVTDERVEVADYARRRGLEHVPQLAGRSLIYELSLFF